MLPCNVSSANEVANLNGISRLPDEVVAKLTSSVIINHLTDVVIGLVKNSLDAGSDRVYVGVDFLLGKCRVQDNGCGIFLEEFQDGSGLGKPFHTSKSRSREIYGSHGRFLAAVGALSNVTLSSKRAFQGSRGLLRIQHANRVAHTYCFSQEQDSQIEEHGTTIFVKNLFTNLPVRAKARHLHQRSFVHDRTSEELFTKLTALILAWHRPIMFQIHDQSSGSTKKLIGTTHEPARSIFHNALPRFDSDFVLGILTQADIIRPDTKMSWVPISVCTSAIQIRGVISLDPEPTKNFQFLSLGIEPLSHESNYSVFFDVINREFSLSKFASAEIGQNEFDVAEEGRRLKDRRFKRDGLTKSRLRGSRKGLDRWPKFCIRIHVRECLDTMDQRLSMGECMPRTSLIVETLCFAVTTWLSDQNMKPQRWNCRQDTSCKTAGGLRLTKSPLPSRGQDLSKLIDVGEPVSVNLPKDDAYQSHGCTISNDGTNEVLPVLRSRPKSGCHGALSSSSRIRRSITDIDKSKCAKYFAPKRNLLARSIFRESQGPPILLNQSEEARDTGTIEQNTAKENDDIPQPASHQDGCNTHPTSIDVAYTFSRNEQMVLADELITWTDRQNQQEYDFDPRSGLMQPKRMSENRDKCSHASVDANLVLKLSMPHRASVADKKETACTGGQDMWLRHFLERWQSPCFRPSGAAIPVLSSHVMESQERGLRKEPHAQIFSTRSRAITRLGISSLNSRQLLKGALLEAEVVSQIDKKFILALLEIQEAKCESKTPHVRKRCSKVLALIDQHAADERCKLERLIAELTASKESSTEEKVIDPTRRPRVASTPLHPPVTMEVSRREISQIRRKATHFACWGIIYNDAQGERPTNEPAKITVTSLPPCILQRCMAEKGLLRDMLRSEAVGKASRDSLEHLEGRVDAIKEQHPWLRWLGDCPRGMVEMLSSRACRSAIMFNDELNMDECKELLQRLGKCAFPFQCAHGRPSMIPLAEVGGWEEDQRLDLGSLSYERESSSSSSSSSSGGGGGGGDTLAMAYQRWQTKGKQPATRSLM